MSCDFKDGKFRLQFFNVRGRAELIRYILTAAKVDWEDVRYSSFEEFNKVKSTTPNGQLPTLEYCGTDGKKLVLTQSSTIARVASEWLGFAGKTPFERALVDEAFEVMRDVFDRANMVYWEPEEARKQTLVKKVTSDILPNNFGFLEKRLAEKGGKYIAGGDGFTYPDFFLSVLLEGMKKRKYVDDETMKTKYPGLENLVCRVNEVSEIKAYLAKREDTDY